MHSEWSDGPPTCAEIAEACLARGYAYAAVTDHSHGLKIAGGMSMDEAPSSSGRSTRSTPRSAPAFRLLQGIEANIGADGALDLAPTKPRPSTLVLAAPHSRLRMADDQTDRMLAAVAHPARPHPRASARPHLGLARRRRRRLGRGVRGRGATGVAVEIDGDPARQDLDYTLARAGARGRMPVRVRQRRAHDSSSATRRPRSPTPAWRAFPADRIVNCWPLERLLAWLADPSARSRRAVAAGLFPACVQHTHRFALFGVRRLAARRFGVSDV